MKTVLFTAALLAMTAEATPGSFHKKVVRQQRQALEHTYGVGLAGLFDENNRITSATLAKDFRRHERFAGRKLINTTKRTVTRAAQQSDEDSQNNQNTDIIEDTVEETTLFLTVSGV